MKVIYIECNAEELKANRTFLDNMTEVFSSITRSLCGVDVTPEMVAKACVACEENEESEDEE